MIVLPVKKHEIVKMQTQEFLKLIIICTSKLNRNILLDCSLNNDKKIFIQGMWTKKIYLTKFGGRKMLRIVLQQKLIYEICINKEEGIKVVNFLKKNCDINSIA